MSLVHKRQLLSDSPNRDYRQFRLEITEGTPDLGVTSYWTDAEGNVVFGPNTPKEKMQTAATGTKKQKRKESVATPPVEKVENKQGCNSRELKEEKSADEAAAELKASDSEQAEDKKEDVNESTPTTSCVQPAESAEEHEATE